MSELLKSIEKMKYEGKKFPKEELEFIIKHKEEALPYLRAAIEKVIEEREDLEDEYQLHFYALFLLGEFQDRESFPKILELATLPEGGADYLLGDLITEGLKDILYNTYNGNLQLLKNAIKDESADEFVRSALADVMGQLYLDGVLEDNEWKDFMKEIIYCAEEQNYLLDTFASAICQCHFVDMLKEIKYMLAQGLMDERTMGKYDSCVDAMFTYRDDEKNFCETPINTIKMLQPWSMFEDMSDPVKIERNKKNFEKLMQAAMKKSKEQEFVTKVGRNDPCPCGSGKKYKFCCLNKPKSPLDSIESAQERSKWLKDYPYIGTERLENRVYLENYFDAESIEIDKLLYLALKNRPGLIWLRDEKQEEKRSGEYLSVAFPMFMEKVKKEGIKTFKEYDEKYSIHYFCQDWMMKLFMFLKKSGNKMLLEEVKKCRKEMI